MLNFSDLIVGAMRFGAWGGNFSLRELEKLVHACIDHNLLDFDHADIYGSYTTEGLFGKLLTKDKNLRSKIRITTKCGIKIPGNQRYDYNIKSYDSSYSHIMFSVEHSLQQLNTDYIDLLLIHRPDFLMDPQEIAKIIGDLKKSGKIIHFGVSNFTQNQLSLLSKYVEIENHQIEFSLRNIHLMENGMIDYCHANGIKLSAWSPLGGGALFSANPGRKGENIQKALKQLSLKYNCGPDQLAYAWIFKHPAKIIPITGTTQISRIKAAYNSRKIVLDKEDWYFLLQAAREKEVD